MGKLGRVLTKGANPQQKQMGAFQMLQALEKRVDALDEFKVDVLRAMKHTFVVVEQRLQNLEDILEAVVVMLGRELVEKKVQDLHIEKLETRAAADKIALELALKEGRVAPSDVVGEKSVVVGSEVDRDGVPLHPLRVQQLWQAIQSPEMKEKLLGKKVGDVIETSIGTKFTVNEVYDITMKAEAAAADPRPVEVPVPETTEVPASEPEDAAVEQALVEDLAEAAKTDENPSN